MEVSLKNVGWPKVTIWLSLATFGLLWLLIVLAFPLFELVSHLRSGQDDLPVRDIFTSMFTPIMVSAIYAFVAAILSIFLALPIAVVIAGSNNYKRSLVAAAVLAPLFVNILLRIYALRYLVLGEGYIANLYGLISAGPIYGTKGLLITGLVYLYLPFAVIPLAISLMNIDVATVEAGVSVGLRGWRLTWTVARHHLLRGILTGMVLTFVPAFGDYLAPAVLGGNNDRMVANYLYDQAVTAGQASVAASGVLILWASTLLAMYGARLLDKKSSPRKRRPWLIAVIRHAFAKVHLKLTSNRRRLGGVLPRKYLSRDSYWNSSRDVYHNPLSRCLPVVPATGASALVILFAWLPVLYTVLIAFSSSSQAALPAGISFRPTIKAFNDSAVIWSIGQSLRVAGLASLLSVLFGGVVAIAANLHGRRLLRLLTYFFLFPLVTPDVMIGLSLGHLANEINLPINWMWIAVSHSVFGASLVFYVVSAAYDQKARDVIDAATVLGVIKLQYITPLIYNLLKKAVLAGVIVAFVMSLDDFAVTYFLKPAGEATFPVIIYNRLSRGMLPQHFAAALLFALINMSLVAIVIFKFGLNAFGLKERSDEKTS